MMTLGRGLRRSTYAVGLSALSLVGCSGHTVRTNFVNDFDCEPMAVTVEPVGDDSYRASGCGQAAVYDCHGSTCTLSATERDSAPPPPRYVSPEAIAQQAEGAERGQARVEKKRKGEKVLALDLRLDSVSILKLRASPSKEDTMQLKLLRTLDDSEADVQSCELSWMIDGQVREAPKAKFARKDTVVAHQVNVPRDLVNDLALARQIAFKSCEEHWSLRIEQIVKVRDFIAMYEEELAWKAKPTSGGSGGLLAPLGGWPPWSGPRAALPVANEDVTLTGTQLYKTLSPSVFLVEAQLSSGTSQGSAVAVSKNELLTNCHVVEDARKIVLKQNGTTQSATIASADPASDRCVLRVSEATLTPVAGVRAYSDLEVGEAVYTMGSPNGLELSLADGLLSGRREEDGRFYVQTTAPISPGSSGGGLFDAHGNLVGVTTMILVGRKHMNQALNFAIPADSFWK
jgi:S1-C subfamily serine protease